jgi:predicted N-acetyltransferase YhbS
MTDIAIRPETPDDHPAIDAIIARAFGPGRFVKVSERLREGNTPLAGVGMVAVAPEGPIGCARMWPVKVGGATIAFLGPLAVDSDARRAGLGAELVEAACQAAKAAGFAAVLLVGDMPFFGRVGFEIAKGIDMPGPTDRRRILIRALVPGGADGLEGVARVP